MIHGKWALALSSAMLTALPIFGSQAFAADGAADSASQAIAGDLQATLAPEGGVCGLFNRPFPENGQAVPLKLTITTTSKTPQQISGTLSARDLFDRPVTGWQPRFEAALPADGVPAVLTIPGPQSYGYYQIEASIAGAHGVASATTEIGIIPPPHPGVRPDSFFATNTSGFKKGQDLAFLQAIGMKVERGHFPMVVQDRQRLSQPADGSAIPLDFTASDKTWAATKAAGLWYLPIVGYSIEGLKTRLATEIGMHGPPRNYDEFVSTWEQIIRHYPDITTYEFWNEPWVFGWTWAATGQEYRDFQVKWCKMALKINPSLRLLAGNSSMFVRDHMALWPECYKGLLQGTTHHPYSRGTGEANWRAGENLRSFDDGLMVTRRMGLPFYYLTEGGTQFRLPEPPAVVTLTKDLAAARSQWPIVPAEQKPAIQERIATLEAELAKYPDARNNLANATKVVQYYVRAALDGIFQGNVQWNIGYGPTWPRANVAFAMMTYLLEDRPVVAEIWPENELICGAIFANPRHVTPEVKSLPRATELSARWNVPIPAERQNDTTKVAVLWSLTGQSNSQLDENGTLTIGDARGLSAHDLTGRPIAPHGSSLVLPFTQAPVYVTTDSLSVIELRARIAGGTIEHVTPVNFYALSLMKPADQKQELIVRMENQLNRPITGTLTLTCEQPLGSSYMPPPNTAHYSIPPAKLVEVAVPWPATKISPTVPWLSPQNQYAVTLKADTDGAGSASKQQLIAVARFVKRTITVDGTLDDWQGITPVLLDSNLAGKDFDVTQYMLNPGLERPTGDAQNKRIVARVYTAYDDDNVYLAAAVNEPKLTNTSGMPAVKGRGNTKVTLPYKSGTPDGLGHITMSGEDAFQFGFGFRDRVPGFGRQMNDPWAWKGQFYDTDYSYIAHISADGDQLTRLWGADTGRTDAYQLEKIPGVGPVSGARIKITRDEEKKLTVYEMSIPRGELKLFDPSQGRLRFGFTFWNDEKLGTPGLDWSELSGVFDHWRCSGSLPPAWIQRLPVQAFFGIEK